MSTLKKSKLSIPKEFFTINFDLKTIRTPKR